MRSNIPCTCEHFDTEHLRSTGACIHKEAGEFCSCDHYYPFRAHVPAIRPIAPLPMKNTVLTAWSRQKQAQG